MNIAILVQRHWMSPKAEIPQLVPFGLHGRLLK